MYNILIEFIEIHFPSTFTFSYFLPKQRLVWSMFKIISDWRFSSHMRTIYPLISALKIYFKGIKCNNPYRYMVYFLIFILCTWIWRINRKLKQNQYCPFMNHSNILSYFWKPFDLFSLFYWAQAKLVAQNFKKKRRRIKSKNMYP